MTTTSHATSSVDTPCMPSSIYPSADVAVASNETPPVGAMVVPMLLPLNMASIDPWCLD
jgi:hypothetical protein